jgi:hypothetical protein
MGTVLKVGTIANDRSDLGNTGGVLAQSLT